MKRKQDAIGIAILSTLLFAATGRAATHSGTVAGTWSAADSPHVVIGDVSVDPATTLVIEAGATVTFASGTGLTVGGILFALGTPGAPITLRSMAWAPSPGEWVGLVAEGQGASVRALCNC